HRHHRRPRKRRAAGGGSRGAGGGTRNPELRARQAARPARSGAQEREHGDGDGGAVVRPLERRAVAAPELDERRRIGLGRSTAVESPVVRVTSEIGPLEAVICHTPGPEVLAVTPETTAAYLYDDIIDLETARREHHHFKAILSHFCTVYEVRDLLEEILDLPEVRPFLIERV